MKAFLEHGNVLWFCVIGLRAQDIKVFKGNQELLGRFKSNCYRAQEGLSREEAGYLRRNE